MTVYNRARPVPNLPPGGNVARRLRLAEEDCVRKSAPKSWEQLKIEELESRVTSLELKVEQLSR